MALPELYPMDASYAVWLTASGGVALWVAWQGWRRRAAPGGRPLFLLMLALAFWSITYAAFWLSASVEARGFWLKMTYFGVATSPVAFFVLVLQFIGRHDWMTKRTYALLLAIPALTLLFLWTDAWHGLFFGGHTVSGKSTILRGGPWFYVFVVYMYGLMMAAIILLYRAHRRSSELYKRQTRVMLAGAILPWVVNAFMVSGWLSPRVELDLTPLSFAVTGLLFAYGLFNYRMMDLIPVGRDVLVEHMDDAILVLDTNGRVVDINPKALELADPGPDSPIGKPLAGVFSRWNDAIMRYADLEGRTEVKLDRPPFSHLDLRVTSLKDRQGKTIGSLVTWRDISARKQAEEQQRVFFHAVEQNPTAVMITDPQGRIEYVNPQFIRLTGYSLEEIRGRNPRLLKSGETQGEFYQTLWNTIKAGQVWEGEILNRRKNGEQFWVNELIAPVLDDEGHAAHFVSMQQDITERKRTEMELRVANTRLQMQLAENEALQARLLEEAIRDGLTRLFNRRFMEETLQREILRTKRDPQPVSVVMMDVDMFKSINDTYGHQAGDLVLQTLGTFLLENTRVSDIACRYGGDEMVVVMPGASLEVGKSRAEEWRNAFSRMEFTFGADTITTTLSLGIASYPHQAHSPMELLTMADNALYWAKTKRNQVVSYDPSTMANRQRHAPSPR